MAHLQLSQQGWISAVEFAEMYSLSDSTAYTKTNNPYVMKIGNSVYINHKALIRRRDFYKRVWLEATDNYYELIDGASQFKLAKVLSKYLGNTPTSWNTWMTLVLFSTAYNDKSLLNYKVSVKLWEFWRFTIWIKMVIKRKNLHHKK